MKIKIHPEVKRHLKAVGFALGVMAAIGVIISLFVLLVSWLGAWSLLLIPTTLVFGALYNFAISEVFP